MPVTLITAVKPGEVSGAGSYVEFETDPVGAPGTYVPFCVSELPEIMIESEQIEITKLCDLTKRYINGLSDTPEITLLASADTANTDLAALVVLTKARAVVNTRFVYANGETSSFALQMLGYGRQQAGGTEELMVAFKGKVSGDIVDGTVV